MIENGNNGLGLSIAPGTIKSDLASERLSAETGSEGSEATGVLFETDAVRARAILPRKRIFIIVGMHRSGTSLCSHILTHLGVDMADEERADPGNPKGHFERWDIVAIHDELLSMFDRAYYSNTHDFPLPAGWWADVRIQKIKEQLKACLSAPSSRSFLFGFKDPRTTKLIPLWNKIFLELQLDPYFIVCFRNPADVAVSLKTRDGLETEVGEFRCLDYLVDAVRYTSDHKRCFLMYEDWFLDPDINTKKLLSFVNPPAITTMQDLEIAIEGVVDSKLNRSSRVGSRPRQPLAMYFFQKLTNLAKVNQDVTADLLEVQIFTQNYVRFRQLLAPFELNYRKIVAEKQRQFDRSFADERSAAEASLNAAQLQVAQSLSDLNTERTAHAATQQSLQEMTSRVRKLEIQIAEREAEHFSLSRRLAEAQATASPDVQTAQKQTEITLVALDTERMAHAKSLNLVTEFTNRVQKLETKIAAAESANRLLTKNLAEAQARARSDLTELQSVQNDVLRLLIIEMINIKRPFSNHKRLATFLRPYLDLQQYLVENPDVRAAGIDPFAHYLKFGAKEGRTITLIRPGKEH